MEDKKLQKEYLSEVSGGVILIPGSNGNPAYFVSGVLINKDDDVNKIAYRVIEKGKQVSPRRPWPQNFQQKLSQNEKFINFCKNRQYNCFNITIEVNGNDIIDVFTTEA